MLRSIATSAVDIAGVTSGFAPIMVGKKASVVADKTAVYQIAGMNFAFGEKGRARIEVNAAPGVGESVTFEFVYTDVDGNEVVADTVTISDLETTGLAVITPTPVFGWAVWRITGSAGHNCDTVWLSLLQDQGPFINITGPRWTPTEVYQGLSGFGPSNASGFKWQLIPFSGSVRIKAFQEPTSTGLIYGYRNEVEVGNASFNGFLFPGFRFSVSMGDSLVQQIRHADTVTKLSSIAEVFPAGDYFPIMGGFQPVSLSQPNQFSALFADDDSGTDEADYELVLPAGGVLDRLIVKTEAAPGTSATLTLTVRKNGVDTGVTCTISGSFSRQAFDLSNSVVFDAGDRCSIAVRATGPIKTPEWIAFGARYAFNSTSFSIPGDIATSNVAGGSIDGDIFTTGTAIFWGIEGDVSVLAKINNQISGDIDVAPLPFWPILGDVFVIRSLNDGFGWAGPWTSYDGED